MDTKKPSAETREEFIKQWVQATEDAVRAAAVDELLKDASESARADFGNAFRMGWIACGEFVRNNFTLVVKKKEPIQ